MGRAFSIFYPPLTHPISKRPRYNRNMGQIEKSVRNRIRKQNIRHAVLATIAIAGSLGMAMVAPNALRLINYIPNMRSRYQTRARRSLERLKNQGYLYENNPKTVSLTARGEALLARLSIGTTKYKPPEKWDKRWRIVIFDIAEKKKRARDRLRDMLRRIGFLKLQSSVWIFPHDCEDIVRLIKVDFALEKEVLYIVAEDIEGDFGLRRHFHLED